MTETGHPGYERLLEDFGRTLAAAAARHARARRHRLRASAGALVLTGVVLGALVLLGVGSRTQLDVAAQASAALAPSGQIVHLLTTEHVQTAGRGPGATSISQQWSASDPPRWRVAFTIPTPTITPGGKSVGNLDGLVTGPMQSSYGEGTEENYYQQPNTLEITTGLRNDGSHAAPRGPLGIEPLDTVRSMLAAHKLRDAGRATVNGRVVRRLLGEELRASNPPWAVEYDIDPRTDAPVRVRIEAPRAAQPAGIAVPVIVLDIDSYQLLPLNANTAALLKIQPAGRPTIQYRRPAGR